MVSSRLLRAEFPAGIMRKELRGLQLLTSSIQFAEASTLLLQLLPRVWKKWQCINASPKSKPLPPPPTTATATARTTRTTRTTTTPTTNKLVWIWSPKLLWRLLRCLKLGLQVLTFAVKLLRFSIDSRGGQTQWIPTGPLQKGGTWWDNHQTASGPPITRANLLWALELFLEGLLGCFKLSLPLCDTHLLPLGSLGVGINHTLDQLGFVSWGLLLARRSLQFFALLFKITGKCLLLLKFLGFGGLAKMSEASHVLYCILLFSLLFGHLLIHINQPHWLPLCSSTRLLWCQDLSLPQRQFHLDKKSAKHPK